MAKARDGEIDAREWSYLRKDGARCPVLLSVIALRDETGKISGFLACANDLTARYRAKVELSEAEARYRSLVELSPDALIVHANGIIDYVNPSAVRLFAAKSAGQMIGIHLLDLMHPESRPEVKARIESIMNGIEVALYAMRRILCFDGAVRTVEMASLGFNQGGRRLAQVIVRDNTERASAEKQLRASETRYRMLIENVFDAIFMHDQGIFTYVNPAAVALFGAQSAQALIGQNYLDWVHPDEREESRLRMRAHLEGTNTVKHVIRRIVRPSGEIRFVSAGLISVEDNGRQLLLGMVQDITERQRAEEQIHILNVSLEERVQERTAELEHSLEQLSQTQVQLVRFEKMAALGGMVAGIAHEINTPVGISVTAAAHLGMKVNDLAERYHAGSLSRSDMAAFIDSASESSQMVLSNLRRAADLIGSFKLVAVDQSDGHRRLFNLKSYIEDVLVSLNPHLGRTGHTVRLLCPEALELYGHPGSFSQIVTNLVLNSLRHGFEGKDAGNIAIEVDEKNDGLRLHYSDDGCGIAVEHLDRIFDPFYTTKRGAGGSGLGLHIVYNIVTQGLGGHITVCNNPDKGVSFDLNIPRSAMMLPDALHPGRAGKMAAG
ncbi:MAG: PAS domain S-box protein [Betaproteobacteria bacterium]